MMRVYLALGSNLGDREGYLKSAIGALPRRNIEIRRCSSIFSTEPREVADQPWVLNAVVEADTVLAPGELLDACLDVEQEYLRTRDTNKGPRTIDIDIIFYENRVVQTAVLQIPHPRFADRRFVLEPLAELAADFIDPSTQKTVSELLESCTDCAEVRRAGPPLCRATSP
jgi:2-amino-4-hydroxy-6-hydroxymethyldihydropteridine diphosphokinase